MNRAVTNDGGGGKRKICPRKAKRLQKRAPELEAISSFQLREAFLLVGVCTWLALLGLFEVGGA